MTSINDLISGLSNLKTESNGSTGPKEKKPKTKWWINVGVEKAGKLVSLPMGIPLDKLEARDVPSSSSKNVEFRNLRLAEKKLWAKVSDIMHQLKPGQTVKLPFTVELRMTEEDEIDTTEDNGENPFDVGDIVLK